MTLAVLHDPIWVDSGAQGKELHQVAERLIDSFKK